jgi:hypothetical protein
MGQNLRSLVSTDVAHLGTVNSRDRGDPWKFLTVDAEHVDAPLSLPNLNCRQAKNLVRVGLWGSHRPVPVSGAW